MCSYGFFDQSFPSIGSVVDSLSEGCAKVRAVSGIIGGAYNLVTFDTTRGANDGVVSCHDAVRPDTITGHFIYVCV